MLETSFIALRLQPYYRNFGKRLVKAPKLYLCDTGLACNLLDMEHADELAIDPMRGALFETAVMSEIQKTALSQGRKPKLYYWRDVNKREADLIIEKGARPWCVIEVKSSATYHSKFFTTISGLGDLLGVPTQRRYVVYAGDYSFQTTQGNIVVIEKSMKLTTDINHAARLLDVDEYGIQGADMLYGFVAGVLAGNYDITELFIDGTLKIVDHDMDAAAALLAKIDAITKDVEVIVTISAAEDALPEGIKKYPHA